MDIEHSRADIVRKGVIYLCLDALGDLTRTPTARQQASKLDHRQTTDCRRGLAGKEILEILRLRLVEIPLRQGAGVDIRRRHLWSRSARIWFPPPREGRAIRARKPA